MDDPRAASPDAPSPEAPELPAPGDGHPGAPADGAGAPAPPGDLLDERGRPHKAESAGPRQVLWWELLLGVVAIWGVELFLGLSLAAFMYATGAQLDAVVLPGAGLTVVGGVWTLVVCWYVACVRCRRSVREAFAIRRPTVTALVLSVVIGMAGAAVAVVMVARFGTGRSAIAKLVSTPLGLAAIGFVAVIVPFVEEGYYRGLLFPALRRYTGAAGTIVLVTVWFGAAHLMQLIGDLALLPVIVVMGFVWTLQRHLTKSLVPAIVSHWVYNACLVLTSVVQLALDLEL